MNVNEDDDSSPYRKMQLTVKIDTNKGTKIIPAHMELKDFTSLE